MDASSRENDRRFWLTHALIPGLAFLVSFALISGLDLDRAISHSVFFDPQSRTWWGAGDGGWWARELVHSGGRWLVRIAAAVALLAWASTFFGSWVRPWRRRAGFAFVAIALSIGIVGGLKAITNIDCPWDLVEFGGDRPYVGLFADRPDSLPRAQCFPGAHSSSGFALAFGYFLFRDGRRRLALVNLLAAVSVGVIFSIGQEARGAHFFSHDLTSAAIVWFVQLMLYACVLRTSASHLVDSRAPANDRLRSESIV